MYAPKQIGIPTKFKQDVTYREHFLHAISTDVVYCFWTLSTRQKLNKDFHYLILPDGCVDIVFDLSKTPTFDGALIMTPSVTAVHLNLKKSFSYVGIRLQPGAWLKSPLKIIGQQTMVKVFAGLDLQSVRQNLSVALPFERTLLLEHLALDLKRRGVIGENSLMHLLLTSPDRVTAVKDFVSVLGYSRRHVQRVFRERVGYSPHDFLKVIRFQQVLTQKTMHEYADQSHYIREFKRITGMTPSMFQKTYS